MAQYSYDSSGALFNYFLLTMLLMVLIPCSLYSKKRTLLLIAWGLVALVTWRSLTMTYVDDKMWNPYDILGIEHGASGATIKRAFRKLSLTYHPDKVKTDKEEAAEKFIEISKANQVLTDEEARKVWEETGRAPGAAQDLKLGVALPSWMVAKETSFIVLFAYIFGFGVALPFFVAKWWNRANVVSKIQILNTTMAMIYNELKQDSTFKSILRIISKAQEFAPLLESTNVDYKLVQLFNTVVSKRKAKVGILYC
jgi:translocation protein SEC63